MTKQISDRTTCTATLLTTFVMVLLATPAATREAHADKPNIVLIMADDMGFGDVRTSNAKSNIPTPHLDRLASQGMTFTDAHSPSAVCTPTRYGLLTGRYCWRSRMKQGVLGGYSPPLIEEDRTTIASMLQANGYHTAAIGKWHLGMNMTSNEENLPAEDRYEDDGNVDFTKPIQDGPTTRGFDYYFGVSASFDMPPYVWIENDHFVTPPTKVHPGTDFPKFIRKGPQSDDVKFDEALDKLAEKATAYIADRAKKDQPFFLYLPLTGPHKPVVPHSRFVGTTKLGLYGDFVVNVDATVGQVLQAIDDQGIADNTLVIFTSDNGSYMYRTDDPQAEDHVDDETAQTYRSDRHTANGPFRGTKSDIFEGGHHVPFFVRWPNKVEALSKCNDTICHTDLFATAAEVVGASLKQDEAEDSFSFLPLTAGNSRATPRAPVIHHSGSAMFAIRAGKWKLIAGNGSGGREKPKGKPFERPYQLFDLSTDLAEKHNIIQEHPQVAEQLESQLEKIRSADRSRE